MSNTSSNNAKKGVRKLSKSSPTFLPSTTTIETGLESDYELIMPPSTSTTSIVSACSTTAQIPSTGTSPGKKIAVTHMLNFEVSSEAVRFIGASTSRRGQCSSVSHNSYQHNGRSSLFNKQRYMHASFRFMCSSDCLSAKGEDPDVPLRWDDVQAVIVSYKIDDPPGCPICLEAPMVSPVKVTCCGHMFCWTCLLRFVSETSPSPSLQSSPPFTEKPSTSKWRKCPICFEPTHMKQWRSVIFEPIQQNFMEGSDTLYDFVLLMKRRTNDLKPTLFENNKAQYGQKDEKFHHVITEDTSWFLENLVDQECYQLLELVETESENAILAEYALGLCEDRRSLLTLGREDVHLTSLPPIFKDQQSQTDPSVTLYFHQSSDGQNVFLHPFSIKMLKAQFGLYSAFPTELKVPVLELEWHGMTLENRRRYKQLAHLPLGTQFAFAEVELSGIVNQDILDSFRVELEQRRVQREKRLAQKNAPRKVSISCLSPDYGFSSEPDLNVSNSDLNDLQEFPLLLSSQSPSFAPQMERPMWKPPSPSPPSQKKFNLMGGAHYSKKR